MSSAEEKLSTAAAFATKFPGFKFAPTDRELICYYLKTKLDGGAGDNNVQLIPEIDITRHEPWDLPARSIIPSETEWYFFYTRGRKYPRGLQSKRMTQHGYWKSTGKESEVKSGPVVIGTKRTLVFHIGQAPKGKRTEWMMHEYSMSGQSRNTPVICRVRKISTKFHSNESGVEQRALMNSKVELHAPQYGGESDHQLSFGSDTQSSDRYEVADKSRLSSEGSTAGDPLIDHQKGYEDELDDFCRNILRDDDDIVGSDECALFGNPDTMLDDPDPMQLQLAPLHGTANRRIRLKKVDSSSKRGWQHYLLPNYRPKIGYFVQMLLTCLTRLSLSSVFVVFLFVLMLFAFLVRKYLF